MTCSSWPFYYDPSSEEPEVKDESPTADNIFEMMKKLYQERPSPPPPPMYVSQQMYKRIEQSLHNPAQMKGFTPYAGLFDEVPDVKAKVSAEVEEKLREDDLAKRVTITGLVLPGTTAPTSDWVDALRQACSQPAVRPYNSRRIR